MISSRPERKATQLILFFVFSFCFPLMLCTSSAQSVATENFPLYPCISANVKFWEDVYSRYSTRQGILHDTDDLGRVYAVIDLVDWEMPDSAKINSERIKDAKARIHALLTDLGSGIPPRTAEEQRIAGLFPKQRHTTYHEARENIRLQIGQSDRFKEGVIRSGRYLAAIQTNFGFPGTSSGTGLPAPCGILFQSQGLQQGRRRRALAVHSVHRQGLHAINQLVDERYDPYLATQAAALVTERELRSAADLATGPHRLQLRSGRNGAGGQRERAVMKTFSNHTTKDDFKFASRNFYSEFLAAMRVAKRMGADSKLPFEQPEATVTLRLKEDTPISRLRSSFRISSENIARLNPALMQPVLRRRKGCPPRVPGANARRRSGKNSACSIKHFVQASSTPDRSYDNTGNQRPNGKISFIVAVNKTINRQPAAQ